jgi:uncharacterized heparinase superfamily protein
VRASPWTWLHTLRFLRREQIAGQLRHRLRSRLERPDRFLAREAPPDPGCRWRSVAAFGPPRPRRDPGALLPRGRFRFLNREEDLGFPPRWSSPELPRLWQYHLHYFEWLWELPLAEARAAVRDWMARHGLARGRVGWEPYPTSLRLSNWCGYFHGRHREEVAEDRPFRAELWASIYRQAEWLRRHLETHLLGNHLLENAVALALCGACFDGGAAREWLRTGRDLLRRELPEQILDDGGHFERSPMYHARAVAALLALQSSGEPSLRELVEAPLERAVLAAIRLGHPDGGIALLNDSALGAADEPAALAGAWARVAGRPAPQAPGLRRPETFALPQTGYYGARTPEGHYLVCDAGPIGPDYLPGHAHGDIFSFELSLAGQRVIRDAGVHGYEDDELRRYCRSTRAHNTVEIEGADQCELWSIFRVGRRGRPREVAFEPSPEGFRLAGRHDGYERLPGRPRHRRAFAWQHRGALVVRDEVEAGRPVRAASRLHLHPGCEVVDLDRGCARLRHPGGEAALAFAGPGRLGLEDSWYCPEFGRALPGRALVYSAAGARIAMGFALVRGSLDDARALSDSLLLP